MQKPVINIDIKLGAKFTTEDLNTEFKKFTISKSELIDTDIEEFNEFSSTGKITETMQNILKKLIKKYMENYIPKYMSCFYNIDSPFTNVESYFYIGIDDDGTITGIPINTSLLTYNDLHKILNNTIMDLIKTKIQFDPRLSYDDIYSCIGSQILVLNNRITNAFLKKSKENKLKLSILSDNLRKLDSALSYEDQNKTEMTFLFDGLVYDEFKKNRNVTTKLITYMTKQKNFYINDYDSNNEDHNNFLADCLIHYDSKSYYDGFKNDLRNANISEFIRNKSLKKAFQIYLNEKVKNLLIRIKKRLVILSDETKNNIASLTNQYKSNNGEYDKYFYNFCTHIENMLYHSENKYIIIKIIFRHDKYALLLNNLNIEKGTTMISYTEQKNGIPTQVVATRTLKYLNDKLDPECKKL